MTLQAFITIVLVIGIVGVIVYFVEKLPMAAPFQTLIRVACIIGCILWLLSYLGIYHLPIGRHGH